MGVELGQSYSRSNQKGKSTRLDVNLSIWNFRLSNSPKISETPTAAWYSQICLKKWTQHSGKVLEEKCKFSGNWL